MIDQFLIGDHRNFVYLITFDGQSLVVDPQRDLAPWQRRIEELNSKLVGVLLTHSHWDHIAGVPEIIGSYGDDVPIYVHQLDAHRLAKDDRTRKRLRWIDEGSRIEVGWVKVDVLHTPGHSAGECCFLLQTEPMQILTGDTVFVGDVGRTDLETGSNEEMFSTIQRLKTLPGSTKLYPGHHYGRVPVSTLAEELRSSPAFQCASVQELAALP